MNSKNHPIFNSITYNMIKKHYGESTTKRSKIPMMNHIDEGLEILIAIDADVDTMCAFCIHPILQSDE